MLITAEFTTGISDLKVHDEPPGNPLKWNSKLCLSMHIKQELNKYFLNE